MRGHKVATINEGGYIYTAGFPKQMVHRESVNIETWGPTCATFLDAKARRQGDEIILTLREGDGGVECIWTTPEFEPVLRERLKTWRTCYGAWPVHTLNGED